MWDKIKNNLFYKILAVVIAVLTWFIVSVNNNPVEVKTFSIPIRVLNERSLVLRNLRLIESHDSFMEIQIKGTVTEVGKVNSSDFAAYVDYSNIINENIEEIDIVRITYDGNANVTYTYKEEDALVHIKVEKIESMDFPVDVEFTGKLPDGFSIVSYSVTPNIQSINDTSSMVENIGHISVSIDIDNIMQPFTLRKACTVYDKQNNVINEYSNMLTVDVNVLIGKIVSVTARVVDTTEIGDDHVFIGSSLEYNQGIIVGDYAQIKDIDVVLTKPLSITGHTSSYSTEADLDLPSNIRFYSINNVQNVNNKIPIRINIEELVLKTFEFLPEELTLQNKNVFREYELLNDIFSVTIKGRAVTLSAINKNLISPYVDASSLHDGINTVQLKILSVGSNVLLTESTPIRIKVESIASFTVDSDNITIANKDSRYDYNIQAENFGLRIIGSDRDVSEVDISKFKYYINVKDLQNGIHLLDLIIDDQQLPSGVRLYEPIRLLVEIREK